MNDLLRNGSGYYDPTAYKALSKLEKENKDMEYYKGDVVFAANTTESERKGCMVILVTNFISVGGEKQNYYLAVPLLRKAPDIVIEGNSEYHCDVLTRIPSVALCEKVMRVTPERITDYVRSCTEKELDEVKTCLRNVFDLPANVEEGFCELVDFCDLDACDYVRNNEQLQKENANLKASVEDLVTANENLEKIKQEALDAVIELQNDVNAQNIRNNVLAEKLAKAEKALKETQDELDAELKRKSPNSDFQKEIERYKRIIDALLNK